MAFPRAPTSRSAFHKAYTSFVARSSCPRRSLHQGSPREVATDLPSTVSILNPPPKPQVQLQQANSLQWLLRPSVGKTVGLHFDERNYVSINDFLNHPEFRHMTLPLLQEAADKDPGRRFIFRYDDFLSKDRWWIRAKGINEPYVVRQKITMKYRPPRQVIFITTLKEWQSYISRIGIPKPRDDDIKLKCILEELEIDLQNRQEVRIHINFEKAIEYGLEFHARVVKADTSWISAIYTSGDEYNFIPPELFDKVEVVTSKQTLLWGNPQPRDMPEVQVPIVDEHPVEYMYEHQGVEPVKEEVPEETMEEARSVIS